jgi:hypothetical protein
MTARRAAGTVEARVMRGSPQRRRRPSKDNRPGSSTPEHRSAIDDPALRARASYREVMLVGSSVARRSARHSADTSHFVQAQITRPLCQV